MALIITVREEDDAPAMLRLQDGTQIEIRVKKRMSGRQWSLLIEAPKEIKVYNPANVVKEGFDYITRKPESR